MTVAKTRWCRRDRRQFLGCLAATGDPARAALSVGRPLEAAFALRAVDREFGEGWAQAVTIAWELVETRVLSRLLAPEEDLPVSARILDSKLALAVLQRRAPVGAVAEAGLAGGAIGTARAMHRTGAVHEENVARLRAEIRALAGDGGLDGAAEAFGPDF